MEQNAQAVLFFGVAAASCIVYSAYQFISFMMNKELISYTRATIIDTNTVVPETMQKNNSRWAIVSFRIDGKDYVSSNRIQVPMSASIGDEIRVAYHKDDPTKLFTPSLKKSGIFFIIGILCITLMFYIKANK